MELVPFKNKDKIKFKKEFIQRYKKLLGKRYDEYIKYSLSYLTRSIRVNTLKSSKKRVKSGLNKQGWKLIKVPFTDNGFWVEHKTGRLDIGNTREHSLGFFYVQEAASMIPPLVLQPKPHEIILDMCAAPGSKTTQIGQYMGNKGLLIANDYTGNRIKPLGINIQRIGLTNTIITRMFGQWFAKKNIEFDRVLVDAPCSGTGTIRKSVKTLRIWNPTMIERLASTQKKLIETGFNILKPGGTLVYSTCSSEPIENEAIISYLLDNYENAEIKDINLKLKISQPITEFQGEKYNPKVKKCLRLWPQDNNTEGFFVAKIVKK